MKVLSLFSGIGAFEKALDNLHIPYELVAYCDFDKYASKSYAAIHGVDESMNLGDITKVDETTLPKDIDLITYGFPCQDISLAGKQKGLFNEDGTQTRSGLFFDALRIIEVTQPRVAIAENVKNLTSKKFSEQFKIVLDSLEEAGYNNYWQVLNAKDYGIPQNRERVFIVSIRKDIDNGGFKFPEGFPLELRLKDMLEDEVDEKFYITNDQASKIINWKAQQKPFEKVLGKESVCPTLTARGAGEYHSGMITYSEENQDTTNMQSQVRDMVSAGEPFIAASRGRNPQNPSDRTPGAPTVQRLEPNSQGICNTLTTVQKDNYVVEPQMIQVGQMYGTERESNPQSGRIYSADGISPTMDSCSGGNRMPKVLVREATKKGYAEAEEGDSINLEQPNSKTRRGRVGKQVAQTLTTSPQQAVVINPLKGKSPYGWHFEQNVYDQEGIVRAVKAGGGSGNIPKVIIEEPTIQRVDIPQTEKVRTYPVDCKALCECLRDHKVESIFSNKEIAEILNVPQDKVESWFKRDDCFAIPDPEIWMQLKRLLKIETNEFDKSIMHF